MIGQDPYRFMFPVGWSLGFVGVMIWAPWLMKYSDFYPGSIHPELMVGGFLVCYSVGFLTTAIPRFTGTQTMTKSERSVVLLFVGILLLSFLLKNAVAIHFSDFLIMLFVLEFARKRFLLRTNEPPSTFLFVGIGIFLSLFSCLGLILIDLHILNEEYQMFFKSIFFTNFMLSLVLGIGSRLVPALLGHQAMPTPMRPSKSINHQSLFNFLSHVPKDIKLLSLIFVLASMLEVSEATIFYARLSRLLLVLYISIKYWRLHLLPKNKGHLYFFIWLACWSIIVGHFLLLLHPQLRISALHLIYISGFGLLTIMISTRVSLSHSGEPLLLEKNSACLLGSGLLISAAAMFRFFSSFVSGHYELFLLIASIAWCLGLTLWISKFGKFWLKKDPHEV